MKIKTSLLVPVFVAILALGAAAQDSSGPKAAGGDSSGSEPVVKGIPKLSSRLDFRFSVRAQK